MKITILCSSEQHPVNQWLAKWIDENQLNHGIILLREKKDLTGGDILFLISCSEIIEAKERSKFSNTLVIHASDLPTGRGWSPHIWSIVNGEERIKLTLLEAADELDSGDIWKKVDIHVSKSALYDEINNEIFNAELKLMDFAVENFSTVKPEQQDPTIKPTYWPKRTPADSEIDINKSINEQFDLIRVCDPDRFPAFFYKNGRKFILKLEAANE